MDVAGKVVVLSFSAPLSDEVLLDGDELARPEPDSGVRRIASGGG
jgi:hypothetical protein